MTISYNPTDKGARTNYPDLIERYIRDGNITAEEIFDLLYNFKKENYWRKYFDLLFNTLGISNENIAHMDMSFYPYRTFNDYLNHKNIDDTYKFLKQVVEMLSGQLEYIFIDGANNKDIVDIFVKDYSIINKTSLPINSGKEHLLYIYKHHTRNTWLIYYACFLYGQTRPSEYYVKKLADHIKSIISPSEKNKMKLCPKCELNPINDDEDLCEVCKNATHSSVKQNNSSQRARPFVQYNEDFIFICELTRCRDKIGYRAYNSENENVGIVFMTDDKRLSSYGDCELSFYPKYENRYGKYHRFTINGGKLKWDVLCARLRKNSKYKCHID